MNAELVHGVYRILFQVNAQRGTPVPQPLKIPRPERDTAGRIQESPTVDDKVRAIEAKLHNARGR